MAYRILGTAADAEDAVQDAWLKWSAADRSQVADPKAYLARIVSNLAMDRLRSTRPSARPTSARGCPEPILTSGDAADDVRTPSRCRWRCWWCWRTLSPLERAVFVLKEVFAFSYAEIAEAVERLRGRGAAGRAPRPRARTGPAAPLPRGPRRGSATVTERFFAAATGGDINTLMELLAPDVTLWTDGGGKVRQAMRPVVGARPGGRVVRRPSARGPTRASSPPT